MNIFYVDKDPYEAAAMLADKHVVKMILETAQLLSTAHRLIDGKLHIEYRDTPRKKKVWVLTALIYLNIAALHHHPYSLLLYALGKSILKSELEN